jgi:thiol:disulfide interchange protein DsbD
MKKIFFTYLILTFCLCFGESNKFFSSSKFLEVEKAFPYTVNINQSSNSINLHFNIQPDYYLYQSKFVFSNSGNLDQQVIFPKAHEKEDEFFGKQNIFDSPISIQINFSDSLKSDDSLSFSFQGCSNKGLCYPPEHKKINISQIQVTDYSESDHYQALLKEKSLIYSLFAFFIAGLLLSLTPCVLPLIPILVTMLVNQKNKRTATVAYVAGISFSYTLIGFFAAATGNFLSTYLQNYWVILLTSLLFVFFALAMFGFFNISLPTQIQTTLFKISSRFNQHKLFGLFLIGSFSSLILSPCVAPPLAGAILYIAQSGSLFMGSISLILLSLGMSVPLIIIGFTRINLNLKTGNWSEKIKQLIGFILLGMAIYTASPILKSTLAFNLYLLLLLSAIVFLLISFLRLNKITTYILISSFVLLFAFYGTKNQPISQKYHNLEFNYVHTLHELNTAITKSNNKSVMIDFYADWCIACLEYEKYTFSDPDVEAHLSKFHLIKVDVTGFNEDDKQMMKKYNVLGPPAIIFYNHQHKELREFQLTGFIKASEFKKHLENFIHE